MLYTALTSVFFCSIIAAMWMHFKKVIDAEKKLYKRKLRVADNKVRLLEMISVDLGFVTDRLSSGIVLKDTDESSDETSADEKKKSGNNLEFKIIGNSKIMSSVNMAVRVFDDMSTLLSIWNNEFERQNVEFDLHQLIRSNVKIFSEHAKKAKKDIKFTFDETSPWYCICDQDHTSRCVRAVLAQATKQTESGEIRIKVSASDPVLTNKSLVTITVTDSSKRPEGEPISYDIVPDRVHRNCYLREDSSSTVRLNLAQHTAIKLGGRLSFHPHSSGNMSFRLCFTAEPTRVEKDKKKSSTGDDSSKANRRKR